MNFIELAEMLNKATQIDLDKFIATGVCTIRFQDSFDVNINWENETNSLCLYASVMATPKNGQADLYALLLRAHLFGGGAQGALFGIHHERNEIILLNKIHTENISEIACLRALNKFIQQAAFWTRQLKKYRVTL